MIDLNFPTWADEGLCAQIGAVDDWFFPDKGGSSKRAKGICAECPVVRKCLEYALEHEVAEDGRPLGRSSRVGIFGGLTPRERTQLAMGEVAA